MLIVIDLLGDAEETMGSNVEEESRLKQEEQRAAWLKWVRDREQVVPQVVPVEPK